MNRASLVLMLLFATPAGAQQAGDIPYEHPELWPHRVASPRLVVHYQQPADRATAEEVLDQLEEAWRIQIRDGGGRRPLDDHGVAGPDGRFDVYLWRGIDTLYVDAVAPNPATPYDDYSAFMVLDPWGQYGGAEMRANVFHELRHASQAADDWWEHIHFFEAEATMWEVAYHGYERLPDVWADVQARPHWTPFRDDGYKTWYMYGGALFMLYLRDHVFDGDLDFGNRLWRLSRNPPGAETDPTLNEPDFADALEEVLADEGTCLFDELVSFARARWYTGENANGTLEAGEVLPEVAHKGHARKSGAKKTHFSVAPQLLGTVYTVVERAPTDGNTLRLSLSNVAAKAQPVVQVVGQGNGDKVVDLSSGSALVRFSHGQVVLAVTMLPFDGEFDPDTVTTKTFKATVNLDKP